MLILNWPWTKRITKILLARNTIFKSLYIGFLSGVKMKFEIRIRILTEIFFSSTHFKFFFSCQKEISKPALEITPLYQPRYTILKLNQQFIEWILWDDHLLIINEIDNLRIQFNKKFFTKIMKFQLYFFISHSIIYV